MDTEKERKALLAKLELLDHARKLHNWTNYNQQQGEIEEEMEEKIDAEASEEEAK